MLEKFKAEKLKSTMFIIAIIAFMMLILFGIQAIFMDSKPNDEKEQKKVADIHIDYTDGTKNEEKSFKSTYGDKLAVLEQNSEKTNQIIASLQKTIEEQKKQTPENSNSANMPELNFPKSNGNGNVLQQNSNGMKNFEIPVVEKKEEPVRKVVSKSIMTIISNDKKDTNETKKVEEKKEVKNKNIVIPAGSFSRGVLMNGLDAPTSGAAQSSPHPVAIRIMDKSILPNKFRADIKDCVAIGLGYGELSSDRAIIKVSSLSCMRKNGIPLVSKGDNIGYVTGEDGKIGLEGRVVSKQGALLARVLVAGFMEGMGKVFQQSSTYVTTSTTGTLSTPDPNKALQTSMYGGAAEASKKMSDYYLKLNDQMFPVVEIANGRKCDVMFTKPVIFEEIKND